MALFDQISEDIKSAMKAEAKTAPGANDTLVDADALKIISNLAKRAKRQGPNLHSGRTARLG